MKKLAQKLEKMKEETMPEWQRIVESLDDDHPLVEYAIERVVKSYQGGWEAYRIKPLNTFRVIYEDNCEMANSDNAWLGKVQVGLRKYLKANGVRAEMDGQDVLVYHTREWWRKL